MLMELQQSYSDQKFFTEEALEVIKKTETTQIHQIEAALKRISEGAFAGSTSRRRTARRSGSVTRCDRPTTTRSVFNDNLLGSSRKHRR